MKKLIVISAITIISGCETLNNATHSVNPYTGERQFNKVSKGAAIGTVGGAATGATLGALFGGGEGAKLGAAIGGGVGLLAGTGTGYYMDEQEAQLRTRMERTGVRVVREGESLRLIMPSNITFKSNSYRISYSFYKTIGSLVEILNEFDETRLSINGFTDSTGSFESNQVLSENRAMAIAEALIRKGVSQSRINTRGLSERYPIADNSSSHGRAMNRRVEMTIEPMKI